jgi:hypothetical protein
MSRNFAVGLMLAVLAVSFPASAQRRDDSKVEQAIKRRAAWQAWELSRNRPPRDHGLNPHGSVHKQHEPRLNVDVDFPRVGGSIR